MHMRQPGRGEDKQQQAGQPPQPFHRRGFFQRTAGPVVHQPADENRQQRQCISEVAGQEEEEIGQPGAQ